MWLTVLGVLVILIGIGMIIGAVVWHSRSSPPTWSGGMIALLVIGILFVFPIGPILIAADYFFANPPLPPEAKTMQTGPRYRLPTVSEKVRAQILAEEAAGLID